MVSTFAGLNRNAAVSWGLLSNLQGTLCNVARDGNGGMVTENMPATGFRDRPQPITVCQRRPQHLTQRSRFRVVVKRVNCVNQRLVQFDGWSVAQRHRTTKRSFILAKTLPAEPFGRPDDPCRRAAREIFLDG